MDDFVICFFFFFLFTTPPAPSLPPEGRSARCRVFLRGTPSYATPLFSPYTLSDADDTVCLAYAAAVRTPSSSHFVLHTQPAAYRALAVLAKAARECVGSFRPQDISMVSLALARMSWDDARLMRAMATRTTETLRAFK